MQEYAWDQQVENLTSRRVWNERSWNCEENIRYGES